MKVEEYERSIAWRNETIERLLGNAHRYEARIVALEGALNAATLLREQDTENLRGVLDRGHSLEGALAPFVADEIQCACLEDYRVRGLEDPHCHYHQWESEILAARALLEVGEDG